MVKSKGCKPKLVRNHDFSFLTLIVKFKDYLVFKADKEGN